MEQEATSTILIRLIRSFEYRNVKQLVLRLNLSSTTVEELTEIVQESKRFVCFYLRRHLYPLTRSQGSKQIQNIYLTESITLVISAVASIAESCGKIITVLLDRYFENLHPRARPQAQQFGDEFRKG